MTQSYLEAEAFFLALPTQSFKMSTKDVMEEVKSDENTIHQSSECTKDLTSVAKFTDSYHTSLSPESEQYTLDNSARTKDIDMKGTGFHNSLPDTHPFNIETSTMVISQDLIKISQKGIIVAPLTHLFPNKSTKLIHQNEAIPALN